MVTEILSKLAPPKVDGAFASTPLMFKLPILEF
jgi:hypothetical protein